MSMGPLKLRGGCCEREGSKPPIDTHTVRGSAAPKGPGDWELTHGVRKDRSLTS